MTTENTPNDPSQENDDKKIASITFQYKDYGLSKDEVKKMLIKAASNLSWTRKPGVPDELNFITEMSFRFAEGKINIQLNESDFVVLCQNDCTEKNAVNLKAFVTELDAIKDGKNNGTGKDVLKEYNSKQPKPKLIILIILGIWWVLFDLPSEGCNKKTFNSSSSIKEVCVLGKDVYAEGDGISSPIIYYNNNGSPANCKKVTIYCPNGQEAFWLEAQRGVGVGDVTAVSCSENITIRTKLVNGFLTQIEFWQYGVPNYLYPNSLFGRKLSGALTDPDANRN